MEQVKKHLDFLGKKVEDRVTGFEGVVTSVSFDLYGCIQGLVNPGIDKDGKTKEQIWFDMNRLKIKCSEPVMKRPNFIHDENPAAKGEKGPAEKPVMNKA